MTILKSKTFWGFATFSSCIGSAVAYDRFEAKKIRDEFLAEARTFGSQPLLPHQSPRLLSFLLISPNADHRRACLAILKEHALNILTVAGVDYKWSVLVDGEEAKKEWDTVAREANQPELMIEEGKPSIPFKDLEEIVIPPILNRTSANDLNESNICLKALRNKFASVPIGEEIVCFDRSTLNSFESELSHIKPPSDSQPILPVKRSSWWQRSPQNSPSPQQLQPVNPEKIKIYFVPCESDQSLLARLQRFLFGQRQLTREIGESVLKIIRNDAQ